MAHDDDPSRRSTRRDFLRTAGALTLATAAGCDDGTGTDALPDADMTLADASPDATDAEELDGVDDFDAPDDFEPHDIGPVPDAPAIASDPFTLGVASGDPDAEGFVLWTRLAPDPLAADGFGGMDDVEVPLIWEVALDAEMTAIVAGGYVPVTRQWAHTTRVIVTGLQADRFYHYRFRVGDAWRSPVGRARTTPVAGAAVDGLRLGVATCQQWRTGYYTSHAHMATEDLDLVAFLGDYIYENGGSGPVRDHDGEVLTLADYRRRYALYKSDPNLQASHQRCPWIVTWDDHEVRNDYAADVHLGADGSLTDISARRAAAYQAWFEHQPVRVPEPAIPVDALPIHRRVVWGDLATFHILDTRQYRSPQQCNGEFGSCQDVTDPTLTMLGEAQREWLVEGLRAASTAWNVLAQQTVFAPFSLGNEFVNPDMWDGYVAERAALLDVMAEPDVSPVLVTTGDIHAAFLNQLHAGGDDDTTPVIGYEVVTTSISSVPNIDGIDVIASTVEEALSYVRYANAANRGYAVVELGRDGFLAHFRVVSTVTAPTAELSTHRTWDVDHAAGTITRIRD